MKRHVILAPLSDATKICMTKRIARVRILMILVLLYQFMFILEAFLHLLQNTSFLVGEVSEILLLKMCLEQK